MYKLFYHPKVEKEILKLEKIEILLVEKIVNNKLTNKPLLFGKALHGELKDYRSIKIRKHRIVYKVTKDKVFVLIIGHRKEVYEKAMKRLG